MNNTLRERNRWTQSLYSCFLQPPVRKGVTHLSNATGAFRSTQLSLSMLLLQIEKAQMKLSYCQIAVHHCQYVCAFVFMELGCHPQNCAMASALWSTVHQKLSHFFLSQLIFLNAGHSVCSLWSVATHFICLLLMFPFSIWLSWDTLSSFLSLLLSEIII